MISDVLLYVFATIGVLAMLWQAYAWIASDPVDRFPDRLRSGEPEGANLAETLSTHLGAPLCEGNVFRHLSNGDEIFPAMLDAIGKAERSIDLLTYVYWTGAIADAFAKALADAAHRGVRVRVVLDAYGAATMSDASATEMEKAGCAVAWFHPLAWYNLRRVNYRTHRRVLVVDEHMGFVGGVGIAQEWTGNAQDADHWRDDHYRVEGPIVAYLHGAFAENWLAATGETIVPLSPAACTADGTARAVPILATPRGRRSPIGFAYWLAFRLAERRVDLTTPYFVPDDALVEAMRAAVRRGVCVRVLVPSDRTDSALVRYASLAFYPALLDAGVEIHEYQPTLIHAKALLVDDEWSLIGTANFDNRSFELNDEIMVVVEDTAFNRTMSASFERDLARAARIDRQAHARTSTLRKLLARLALSLRPLI